LFLHGFLNAILSTKSLSFSNHYAAENISNILEIIVVGLSNEEYSNDIEYATKKELFYCSQTVIRL
jgi:hypothetical protein